MCVTFTPASTQFLSDWIKRPLNLAYPKEAYPGYQAPIIFKQENELTVQTAVFGLIPAWAKDKGFSKHTYNARTETVAEKPSYKNAWRQGRFCLVPMQRFVEPNYESGKSAPWHIYRRDYATFAVAGIWEHWTDKQSGEIITSFSMLTINADGHPIMGRFHRPGDEKRSLVVVGEADWEKWLTATSKVAGEMFLPMNEEVFTTALRQ